MSDHERYEGEDYNNFEENEIYKDREWEQYPEDDYDHLYGLDDEVEDFYNLAYWVNECHSSSYQAGWWGTLGYYDRNLKDPLFLATKIALMHSELSEALEGLRKDTMDDHLPHRKTLEVELADLAIRLFDLCGALEIDLEATIIEKMNYNAKRADHKLENREKEGGKKF